MATHCDTFACQWRIHLVANCILTSRSTSLAVDVSHDLLDCFLARFPMICHSNPILVISTILTITYQSAQ